MEQNDREKLKEGLSGFMNQELSRIIISNPVQGSGISRVKIRPVLLSGSLLFQAEEQVGAQAFHKNMEKEECILYTAALMDSDFRQLELESKLGQMRVLVSKKGSVSIKTKKTPAKITTPVAGVMGHNREKHYVLEEGRPVPFLVDLGVMTEDGKIVKARYDKFKQINRFLEFIEDILPKLNRDKENVIIDFGCGKSYLTFAMYYYLHELKGYPIRVIGLDLKQAVIDRCNQLSEQYGYGNLKFYHGDIASYEGVDHVDMVVTLHACDTATDYALAKAVHWGASVILSVPCCQHELNKQITNDTLTSVLKYGILKERMAALITDGLRAELLENQGYRTQLLEFIDMEHTPKNLLIRAVKQGGKKDNRKEIERILEEFHTGQTLAELLWR